MIRDDRDGWMRIRRTRSKWINNPEQSRLYERQYPTVYDCDEFAAFANERTIREILNGHCAYYGLGAEMDRTEPAAKGVTRQAREEDLLIARLRDTWRALKE